MQKETMSVNDSRRVVVELELLGHQVADMIRRFEAAGMTTIMKDDYVALHALEHRILEMRREHLIQIGSSSR